MTRSFLVSLFCCGCVSLTAQNVFTITPGATLAATGNAVVTLRDMDLNNQGIISGSGTTKFVFSGGGNSKIACTGTTSFDSIEMIKTNNAGAALWQDITMNGGIIFSNGFLDLNRFTITLQPGASLQGESDNSRIIGSAGGYVQTTSMLHAPSAANPGNLGAIITAAQDMGSTLIQRGHQSQTTGSGTGASIERYYNIIPSINTGLNASLRFEYFDAELNGRDKNLLTLWKSTDNSHWKDMGFTSRDPQLHYAGLNGITDFSRWTLSDIAGALPLTLLYFHANCNNNKVSFSWKTASELNIDKFIIQQSNNGNSWTTVKTVLSKGNANTEQLYEATDDNLPGGSSIYRLQIMERDASISYSSVVKNNCRMTEYITATPNPVSERLQLTIFVIQPAQADIKFFDTRGRLLQTKTAVLAAGVNSLSLDVAQLLPGVYLISVRASNGLNQVIKIVRQ